MYNHNTDVIRRDTIIHDLFTIKKQKDLMSIGLCLFVFYIDCTIIYIYYVQCVV